MPAELWDLLEAWRVLDERWEAEKTEEARVAMRAAWQPDRRGLGVRGAKPGDYQRCTAVVLSTDTWRRELDNVGDHLHFRGACLGCGWVSETVRGDENGGAEDAVDHAWPGWRDLPVVEGQPYAEGPSATAKAEVKWKARWVPLYPAGWLEAGGPVRTTRKGGGTRHVPGRTPWGGYDMADVAPPVLSTGQLVFALGADLEVKPKRRRKPSTSQVARAPTREPARVKVDGRDVVDVPTGERL